MEVSGVANKKKIQELSRIDANKVTPVTHHLSSSASWGIQTMQLISCLPIRFALIADLQIRNGQVFLLALSSAWIVQDNTEALVFI